LSGQSRFRHALPSLLVTTLLGVGLAVIHHELSRYHLGDIRRSFAEIPSFRIAIAFVLTAASYLVLTSYDFLALVHIQRKLPYRRIATASFVGYVFSYNIGLSILGGSATRYRLYSSWGLSTLEIAKVIAFCGLTFWTGVFATGGIAFVMEPLVVTEALHLPLGTVRPLGIVLLAACFGYLAATRLRTRPFKIRAIDLSLPRPRLALAQIVVSVLDWLLASSVLYVLLPSSASASISYPHFIGVYLLAQMAGVLSHVPGGLGIVETVMLFFLVPPSTAPEVLASVVAYRIIYYLVPLFLATAVLGLNEIFLHREKLGRVLVSLEWVPRVLPSVYGLAVFAAGVLLLFSGATPAEGERLRWLREVVPLPVVEVSHFLGSLVGASLLVLGRSLQRRIDAAYYSTLVLLALGIVVSILKGLDFEEASILTLLLAALLPAREQFFRPASLLSRRFSFRWTLAIAAAVGTSLWLLLFSFKHVELTGMRFWEVAFDAEASRSLRATVSGAAFAVILLASRFFRPAPRWEAPAPSNIVIAQPVVARSRNTTANLALLGDKRFLFNEDASAFVMYSVEGRSFIAMGDPVGEESERRELAWKFREMADRHGGWPVFYEVGPESLPLYLELGLTLLKLGEEGFIPLPEFTLEGGANKGIRTGVNRLRKEGCVFRLVPVEEVATLLPNLREVSDEWLADKSTREKGFSLGFFREDYVRLFPAATIWREGRLLAFANLWMGADKEEISIDLMRYRPTDAPPGIMDFLFAEILLWAKENGYRWFRLGMAPLSGLEDHQLAPLWTRVGAVVFRHGEHFYNFQGLRKYKEKFHPDWVPRYLACPGGFTLPTVLTNVATLVSGGIGGVFKR
jgi:phosphatidylglycerol lysyltransferase